MHLRVARTIKCKDEDLQQNNCISILQVESSIEQVVKEFGRLDGVANCIGSVLLKSAHTTTDKEVEYFSITEAGSGC